jgi:hypothetical protein
MRQMQKLLRLTTGVALCGALALGTAPSARAAFVVDGAEHLLTIQDSLGFFHDAGPTTFFAPTQGMMGLGMLTAYQQSCLVSCNSSYLASAIKLGDALLDPQSHASIPSTIADSQLYFDPGTGSGDRQNPIIWTQNTLFLQRLSQVTGNSAYSAFLKTQFWDKLAAGSYGAGTTANAYSPTGVNTAGFVSVVQVRCDESSPSCLAKPAVAAHMAGQGGITGQLILGIQAGLESFSGPEDGTFGLEILGLASAIWASAITGINIDPATGWWAGANSTQDLGAMLAALIDGSGGFPAGIYSGAPATDLETTGAAILALALLNNTGDYTDEIQDALAFMQAQQGVDGCVESDGICFAGTSGAVLQFYGEVVLDDTVIPPILRSPEEIVHTFYAPEPLSVALFGASLAGMALARRRRNAL